MSVQFFKTGIVSVSKDSVKMLIIDYLTDENGTILTDENGEELGYSVSDTNWHYLTDENGTILTDENGEVLGYSVTDTNWHGFVEGYNAMSIFHDHIMMNEIIEW